MQFLGARLELLIDFDGLLGHLLMRFLRTTHERKVRPGRHALVSVRIQPDSKNQRFRQRLSFSDIRHKNSVGARCGEVKIAAARKIFRNASKFSLTIIAHLLNFCIDRNNRTMKKLSSVQQKFILHWGEMGTRWGINRTVAQVHALLYISPAPLNADDIVGTLNVA